MLLVVVLHMYIPLYILAQCRALESTVAISLKSANWVLQSCQFYSIITVYTVCKKTCSWSKWICDQCGSEYILMFQMKKVICTICKDDILTYLICTILNQNDIVFIVAHLCNLKLDAISLENRLRWSGRTPRLSQESKEPSSCILRLRWMVKNMQSESKEYKNKSMK